MENNFYAIGADIGGTHITAAVVDLEKRSLLPGSLVREKVDSHAPHPEIINVWSKAIRNAKKELVIIKVSLAMPGPFDYEEGTCLIRDQDKYEDLYGLNVKELLSQELGSQPEHIALINDAASFLQGEAFGGAAQGFQTAMGITLGTGLGTAIYNGHHATNADLWKLPFRSGIAEDYLSTRWFISRWQEITGQKVNGVHELLQLTSTDVRIDKVLEEFGQNLAGFLIEFMKLAASDVIVIGGNISKCYKRFKEPLMERLHHQYPNVTIKTAVLGEEAALMGAASYWKQVENSLQKSL